MTQQETIAKQIRLAANRNKRLMNNHSRHINNQEFHCFFCINERRKQGMRTNFRHFQAQQREAVIEMEEMSMR